MSKFIFFTKTNWQEPPRLRHQLANLLLGHGHHIAFFEKPHSFLKRNKPPTSEKRNLVFYRTSEIIYRKLRLNKTCRNINASHEVVQIKKTMNSFGEYDQYIVVNFNYDYFFLRKIFPKNKILTIINDDFCCRALLGYEAPLKAALADTCRNSDVVLTVSYPLQEQLLNYCNTQIFFPWADIQYKAPRNDSQRSILLFWGYINNRLNFDYIIDLSQKITQLNLNVDLFFIGPVEKNIDNRFKILQSLPNIKVKGATPIKDLNFDNVLAAFIPYISGNQADDVTSIPNKAFPMLANGIPLLITGMPNFIKKPFVIRMGENIDVDISQITNLKNNFTKLQDEISFFVNQNTGAHRYKQFMSYVD